MLDIKSSINKNMNSTNVIYFNLNINNLKLNKVIKSIPKLSTLINSGSRC
jgi:hypothetical protein